MEWRYNLDQIGETASRLWNEVKDQTIVTFNGELGAGKTTLIQALCLLLEVPGKVSSPTFSIINEYASSAGRIYHIDLYRCGSEEEAIRAGVEECLYSGGLCFVEWPSRAPGIFPDHITQVSIRLVDDQTRLLIVEPVSRKELKTATGL